MKRVLVTQEKELFERRIREEESEYFRKRHQRDEIEASKRQFQSMKVESQRLIEGKNREQYHMRVQEKNDKVSKTSEKIG